MHRFKFTPDDLFINRLKTYPEYNVFIYQGRMHVNRDTTLQGNGGISVYDINTNRTESLIQPFLIANTKKEAFKIYQHQPLVKNHSGDFQWATSYVNGVSQASITQSVPTFLNLMPPPFLTPLGFQITASYGVESPITRQLSGRINEFTGNYFDINGAQTGPQTISFINHNPTASALQNVARKYTTLSDHFILSSSTRDLVTGPAGDNINFIMIPSMYYGSSIKKGSVELNYYITGSKIASCADINHNGTLIGTTGSTSGSVVGLVMYDEGVIMLTSSVNLETGPALNIRYNGNSLSAVESSWLYYGTTLNDSISPTSTNIEKTSFDLNFKGTSYVNSMTMFAHARKGHLNHSNNPTYRDLTFARSFTTGSGRTYLEGESPIANVVSASYVSASFEKTTYISKVHVYDEDGNLIAITSMAKPIKKTLNDEFTFKMKLDL
tara:strand:- start:43 stop:1359 length:1317 start_codon:yes stop_codon:yes gene_type:complete